MERLSSWDDYQVQFQLIAELNSWNSSTMAIYLANSRRNYQAHAEVLSLRFGSGGKIEVFRSQPKSRTRGKDESLPELAQAIQRLVRQTYPKAPLSVREVLEKDYFVDAIADTDIRWKILQTRQGTIQETLAIATEVVWRVFSVKIQNLVSNMLIFYSNIQSCYLNLELFNSNMISFYFDFQFVN